MSSDDIERFTNKGDLYDKVHKRYKPSIEEPNTEELKEKFSFVSIWKRPCRSCRTMVLRISCMNGRCHECEKLLKEQKRQKDLYDRDGWTAQCPCCNRLHSMSLAACFMKKKIGIQYPCWRHDSLKFILLSTAACVGSTLVGVALLLVVVYLAQDELGGKTFVGNGLHPGLLYVIMGILPVGIIVVSFAAFIEGIVRTVGRIFYVTWSQKQKGGNKPESSE